MHTSIYNTSLGYEFWIRMPWLLIFVIILLHSSRSWKLWTNRSSSLSLSVLFFARECQIFKISLQDLTQVSLPYSQGCGLFSSAVKQFSLMKQFQQCSLIFSRCQIDLEELVFLYFLLAMVLSVLLVIFSNLRVRLPLRDILK